VYKLVGRFSYFASFVTARNGLEYNTDVMGPKLETNGMGTTIFNFKTP
jgi:hypothetical protein